MEFVCRCRLDALDIGCLLNISRTGWIDRVNVVTIRDLVLVIGRKNIFSKWIKRNRFRLSSIMLHVACFHSFYEMEEATLKSTVDLGRGLRKYAADVHRVFMFGVRKIRQAVGRWHRRMWLRVLNSSDHVSSFCPISMIINMWVYIVRLSCVLPVKAFFSFPTSVGLLSVHYAHSSFPSQL